MKDEAREQHELSRHRANRRPLPNVTERRDRDGVDEQLAGVARHLDQEDPAVVPPQAATCRLEEGDVEARRLIVMIEDLVPAVIDPRTLPAEDRAPYPAMQDPAGAAGFDRESRAVMELASVSVADDGWNNASLLDIVVRRDRCPNCGSYD
jgi:hypothetical protein